MISTLYIKNNILKKVSKIAEVKKVLIFFVRNKILLIIKYCKFRLYSVAS